MATGGGEADEIITERDEGSPNWKQESKPDTICDEILITIPTEQKNSSRIYVFFETGHPGHPQQKTEVHGPFLEAVIADNALLVKTADEETSLELARYEEGADWWRRRHIGKD